MSKPLKIDLETKMVSEICKALGHPTRVEIMTLLWRRDKRTCGEIVELVSLAQSTVSKHLLELKKANLVSIKNVGKKVIYSIDVDSIEILKKYLTHYLSTIEIAEENKETVLTTKHKVRNRNSHLKQYNYQFLYKKSKQETLDLVEI